MTTETAEHVVFELTGTSETPVESLQHKQTFPWVMTQSNINVEEIKRKFRIKEGVQKRVKY